MCADRVPEFWTIYSMHLFPRKSTTKCTEGGKTVNKSPRFNRKRMHCIVKYETFPEGHHIFL